MISVRLERPEDIPKVRTINEEAFGHLVEANLVDGLRRSCPDALSLVAEDDGLLVGHIMFSPAIICDQQREIQGMALARWLFNPVANARVLAQIWSGEDLKF